MRDRSFWERLLIGIWPTIRRIVNDSWFFLERIIKSFIRIVLEEI
jgi:hypothetical protein